MTETPRFAVLDGIAVNELTFSQNELTVQINFHGKGSQKFPVIKSDANCRNNRKKA